MGTGKFNVASVEQEMVASAAKSLKARRALTLRWLVANSDTKVTDLAGVLRVRADTTYRYLSGKRGMPDLTEEIVCSYYQISIEELRSGKPIERIRHV